jgi:hypothetical protein
MPCVGDSGEPKGSQLGEKLAPLGVKLFLGDERLAAEFFEPK